MIIICDYIYDFFVGWLCCHLRGVGRKKVHKSFLVGEGEIIRLTPQLWTQLLLQTGPGQLIFRVWMDFSNWIDSKSRWIAIDFFLLSPLFSSLFNFHFPALRPLELSPIHSNFSLILHETNLSYQLWCYSTQFFIYIANYKSNFNELRRIHSNFFLILHEINFIYQLWCYSVIFDGIFNKVLYLFC